MAEIDFICPNDVGFLASELNSQEALETFLNYFGIGVVFMADKKQQPPKPQNPTPTKPIRKPPEIDYVIRRTPAHKVPQTGKK